MAEVLLSARQTEETATEQAPRLVDPKELRVARGVVKWFNQVSDYGYVACDQGGPDRYVRGENITGGSSMLLAGSRVEFEPREGGMGPEAINVCPLPLIRDRSSGSCRTIAEAGVV